MAPTDKAPFKSPIPLGDAPVSGASEPAAEGSSPAHDSSAYRELDADFVRVLEDLVDVLILRGVIRITDLPIEAQSKLMARKSFRDRTNHDALNLLWPNEGKETS